MKTRQVEARHLRVGDEVVNAVGQTRVVTGNPQRCVARGYVKVRTTGRPVNCHGRDEVTVKVQDPSVTNVDVMTRNPDALLDYMAGIEGK